MPQFIGFGDGSDGDLVISSNTVESPTDSLCYGLAGQKDLIVPAAAGYVPNQIVKIWQSRGGVPGDSEYNQVESYSGTTLTLRNNLEHTYYHSSNSGFAVDKAQVRVVKQFRSVTINLGVVWQPKAWDPSLGLGGLLDFLCCGKVLNLGTISATGRGFFAGLGAPNSTVQTGEGANNVILTETYSTGSTGGGGHQDQPGAGGGHASAGSNAGSLNIGGTAIGTADVIRQFMGGGGGGGSAGLGSGNGGIGGGVIDFCAAYLDNSAGLIITNGNNGTSGGAGRGGGGGAAGTIRARTFSALYAFQSLQASGGGGGSGGEGTGGNGSEGRIRVESCLINNEPTPAYPTLSRAIGGHSYCLVPGQII